MSAEEALVQKAFWGFSEGRRRGFAKDALAVLAAAGYAVVELPEATGDYDTGLEFSEGSVAGTVLAGAGTVHHGGWEWTPEGARAVGANWLAASVAAAGGVVEP